MRDIVTPPTARGQQAIVLTPEQKLAWEAAREKAEQEILGKRQKIAEDLAAALEPLSPLTQRRVRMGVALRAPQKPMTADQLQDWLDEQTIGVARYMVTGKIVP